jgi:hypothetical protein
MASLRYHAGRMVLYEAGNGWGVRIKAQSKRLDLPLSATCLADAIVEAEGLYRDATVLLTRKGPRCYECVHWEVVAAKCGLDFPEGRASGGVYAQDCSAYWAKR